MRTNDIAEAVLKIQISRLNTGILTEAEYPFSMLHRKELSRFLQYGFFRREFRF